MCDPDAAGVAGALEPGLLGDLVVALGGMTPGLGTSCDATRAGDGALDTGGAGVSAVASDAAGGS